MKQRNYVAKYLRKFNKPKVESNKKRKIKNGYTKYVNNSTTYLDWDYIKYVNYIMDVTLKFDANEEKYELDAALDSVDMKIAISDFYDVIRDIIKYDNPSFSNTDNMIDYIKEQYINLLGEYLDD